MRKFHRMGALAFFFVAMAAAPAAAGYAQMSASAASKLSAYDEVGLGAPCLPVGDGVLIKKFYPLDNHHIMFFLTDGRIFVGETAATKACDNLVNGKNFGFDLNHSGALCIGDAIVSSTGPGVRASPSGGWTGGAQTDRACIFTHFQELKVKAPR